MNAQKNENQRLGFIKSLQDFYTTVSTAKLAFSC